MITGPEAALAPERGAGRGGAAAVAALASAVATEARLLEELIAVLRRQRDAVAAEDYQAVDDSVFATHRVLLTLNEACRRRRTVSRLLGGAEEFPLRELEARLGARMTDELRAAQQRLTRAAATLEGEVAVNRSTLRGALGAGEALARAG